MESYNWPWTVGGLVTALVNAGLPIERLRGLPLDVWRILKRQGLISPEPHKRPKASFVRFEAQLPNELWHTDATD